MRKFSQKEESRWKFLLLHLNRIFKSRLNIIFFLAHWYLVQYITIGSDSPLHLKIAFNGEH